MRATAAGTSSSATSLAWPSTLGGTILDGGVTWQNVGYQVTHTSSANAPPSATSKGNVSVSTLVTNVSSIVDNLSGGGGTGYTQNCTVAGLAGASHPTWATSGGSESAGLVTNDNGLQWTNGGSAGAPNTGTWVYGFSFSNSVTEHESSMSPASTQILLASQSAIGVGGNGDPNFATDGVDTVNIYRSTTGSQSPLLRLTSIAAPANGAPWSYIDASGTGSDTTALNALITADTSGNNAPPATGLTNLVWYLDRMIGSNGEFVNWSGVATQPVGVGAESFGGLNFFQMPATVNSAFASATGLLIFPTSGVYFSQGVDGFGNPAQPVQILKDFGLLSPNLLTINGSIPAMFTSDGQLVTLDPSSGVQRVSDPIADTAQGMGGFSTTNSYLTWHTNGTDQAYFLCDGSTGWFRLAPTSAPETGFTWSPKANIVGGVGCVKSIETVSGTKQMLMGVSSGSGPILKRDLSINQDNGVSYVASVTFGCIVFAQPNQCAEIESVTTECLAIGSHPQVYILGDEVDVNGAFELLQLRTPDPPFLEASKSVYADRWYFNQLKQPAWMRYMLMKVSWPAENFANEMLAHSFYGCIHLEG
jgi:hypothetical protein